MELLLGFLRNPKFRLRPVIELLQNHIEPLKATTHWGPSVPYNITGQMNLHPRAAIQFLAGAERDNYVKFYDQVAIDA
jgi:4-hydroxy 2-oxovalerate aldolase